MFLGQKPQESAVFCVFRVKIGHKTHFSTPIRHNFKINTNKQTQQDANKKIKHNNTYKNISDDHHKNIFLTS